MGHGTNARLSRVVQVAGAALAISGCGSGDVYAGQLQEGLNLDACAGTTCVGTNPRELALPEPQSCDGPLGAELIEDFSVEVPLETCSDPRTCQYGVLDFDVAPDGNSWVLGYTSHVTDDPEGELWATHFSSEGELLGSHKVATAFSFNGGSVGQTGDLTVDARGHAYVLVYQIDAGPNADAAIAEQSWLTELDAEGEVANGPIALAGIAAGEVVARDDGTVALAASALQHQAHSIVAALTSTGERVWSRADLPSAGYSNPEGMIAGLRASSSGALIVLAKRQRDSNGDYTFGLTRFDEAGNPKWDVVLDRRLAYLGMASGGDGDALLHDVNTISYVGSDGTGGWSYELPNFVESAAIDAERERAYAVSQVTPAEGTAADPFVSGDPFALHELLSVSVDGENCERHRLPTGTPTGYLHVDAEGRFYFVGEAVAPNGQPHSGHLVTRLRLPEE
jgi:hypothetical protein